MHAFVRRVFARRRRPLTQEERIVNAVVRAILLIGLIGYLIYLGMYYF